VNWKLAITLLALLAWSHIAFGDEFGKAIFADDLEKVKALLKDHPELANKNKPPGSAPLLITVWGSKSAVVFTELLLASGADVNVTNSFGDTPLHNAVQGNNYNCVEVVELLLTNKANVNAANTNGDTPLLLAVQRESNRCRMAKLLLDYKADVNAKQKDNRGETPLHYAAMRGDKELAELLLARGANVNARDGRGFTPLQSAVPRISTNELAELVKESKAPPNSPLTIRGNREGVAILLLQHGGHE
jgi:cytohesin